MFILGAVYLSHENSKDHYSGLFNDLSYDICKIKSKYDLPFILIGDFNSRTGTVDDFITMDQNDLIDSSNFEYIDFVNTFSILDVPEKRANVDTKVNNNGRRLIELCKCNEFCIVNGRFGSDKSIGKTTFHDKSTVDYVICTPDILPSITDFVVDTFDRLLFTKKCSSD